MVKEKNDILGELGQLVQMGVALRTGKMPQKEKPKVPTEAPRGKPAIKQEAKAAADKSKYADIKAKEGTKEWHEEVYRGLERGQLAPKVLTTAESARVARNKLTIEANKSQIKFLTKGRSIPDNDLVVEVFADIARSPYRGNAKFLIAKEAQLLSSASGLPVAEQAKILQGTKLIDDYIFEAYQKTKPEFVRMTMRLHAEALDREMKDASQETEKEENDETELAGEHKLTDEEMEVVEDVRASIRDQLVAAAGDDKVLAARAEALRIPEEAAVFIGVEMASGTSFKDAVKQYADAVRPHIEARPMDEANSKRIAFLGNAAVILREPNLLHLPEMTAGAISPPKVYDAGWTFPNADVQEYLRELQSKIDNDPYFIRDSRKIDQALEKVAGFKSADLPTGTGANPLGELKRHFGELQAAFRGRGEGITDQFSDLYMSAQKRGLMAIFPKWIPSELYRQFNEMITYNTRGVIAEQFQRDISQVASYYANQQFERDLRELFTNDHPDHLNSLAAIEEATGAKLSDPEVGGKIENHPFFKDRVDACNAAKKEVADLMNAKENLTYAYGVVKSGEKFEVHKSVLGELGDRGIFTIKTSNDYLTGVAYDLFDTKAQDLVYDLKKGGSRRIGDTEMALLFNDVVEVMLQNKDIIEARFKGYWEAESSIMAGQDFSKLLKALHIEAYETKMDFGKGNERLIGMVKEAQKLYTASLREVYVRERSLSPGESGGQRGQAPKYGAEEGIYAYLKGRRPIGFFIERWDLPSAAGRLHLHVMADQYARLMGIDQAIEPSLNQAMVDIEYKRELVERALGVVEKAGEQPALKTFFEFDLKGNKIVHPPESIESLTKEQLKQLVLYKEGVKYADLVLGSYDYEGATWISHAKKTALELIYGEDSWKRGIGMGEVKRMQGSDLISAEDHTVRKAAEDKLIYGRVLNHGEVGNPDVARGVLRVEADFAPQRGFQNLMEHNHIGMRTEFRAMVNDHMFDGVFNVRDIIEFNTDGSPKTYSWKEVVITGDRPDLVYTYLKPIYRMTDEFLSYGKDLETGAVIDSSPINYATGPTAEQDLVLTKICQNMQVNKTQYLAIMKRLSDYVGQKSQLQEMVKPQYLDTYTTIQDLDSREKFLDAPDKVPGTKYKKGTSAIDYDVIEKASGHMGGQEGKSKMCGIARVSGDCANASDNAMLMSDMLGTLSEKKLLQTLPDYAKNVLFVYGNTWKHRAVGIMVGSWAKCARMDPIYDWTMLGSLNTMIHSSPFRRVTDMVGDHGAPSKTLNELHQFWEQMQIESGITMVDAKHLNHFEEYELGLVNKAGSRLPWYLYTYSFAGILAGLGLGAALANEAGEEFSKASGVGGKEG